MLTKRKTVTPKIYTNGSVRMHIADGFVVIVDEADYAYVSQFRWYPKKSGSCYYAVRKVRRGGHEHLIRMHRELCPARDDEDVHHINHNTMDNRRANLKPLSRSEHDKIHRFS